MWFDGLLEPVIEKGLEGLSGILSRTAVSKVDNDLSKLIFGFLSSFCDRSISNWIAFLVVSVGRGALPTSIFSQIDASLSCSPCFGPFSHMYIMTAETADLTAEPLKIYGSCRTTSDEMRSIQPKDGLIWTDLEVYPAVS